jgi:hypothetical protein
MSCNQADATSRSRSSGATAPAISSAAAATAWTCAHRSPRSVRSSLANRCAAATSTPRTVRTTDQARQRDAHTAELSPLRSRARHRAAPRDRLRAACRPCSPGASPARHRADLHEHLEAARFCRRRGHGRGGRSASLCRIGVPVADAGGVQGPDSAVRPCAGDRARSADGVGAQLVGWDESTQEHRAVVADSGQGALVRRERYRPDGVGVVGEKLPETAGDGSAGEAHRSAPPDDAR